MKSGIDWADGVPESRLEELRNEEQIVQARKLEALGRLAGGVAHDFNNLLTVILGYGRSLLDATEPEGRRLRQDLRQIVEAGERGATLAQQMLAFSRDPRSVAPVGVQETPASPAPPDEGAIVEKRPSGLTVLVVEDDVSVMQFASTLLRRNGYQVIEAPSAEDALLLVDQPEAPVDLLVTDVLLPGLSGCDLAARVHRRWPDMPVLLMSGNPDPVSTPDELDEAGFPLLEKPFASHTLLETVHELLAAGDAHVPAPHHLGA